MKIINAKGLSRFAASGCIPEKVGYLMKRGELNKGFQKRWFVLKGNLLFYYDKKGDREPTGVIIMEGTRIEIADFEGADSYAFQIIFSGSRTRNYILSTDNQEDLEAWMRALSCAPYDYLKVIVTELENQAKETFCVGNAKLIQQAERDSNLFSHTYSKDYGSDKSEQPPPRPPSPKQRRNPFGDVEEVEGYRTSSDLAQDVNHRESGNSVGVSDGSGVYDFFDSRDSVVSLSHNMTTWYTLGVSNFYEMHDVIRKQIKDFNTKS